MFDEFKKCMHRKFVIIYLRRIEYFLGIQVTQYAKRILDMLKKYVKKNLERFGAKH